MLVSSAQEMRDDGRDREALRFDGPVRVRTSLTAIAITATVPACFIALIAFNVCALSFDAFELASAQGPSLIATLAFPARVFLTTLLGTDLLASTFVLAAHLLARALGFSSGVAYAGAGAATGAAFSILFAPFVSIWFVLIPPAVVFGAVMGALYRRFAGLEAARQPKSSIVPDEHAPSHPPRCPRPVIVD